LNRWVARSPYREPTSRCVRIGSGLRLGIRMAATTSELPNQMIPSRTCNHCAPTTTQSIESTS
jgi:hypothetical protein